MIRMPVIGNLSAAYRASARIFSNRRSLLTWWDGKLRSLLFDVTAAALAVYQADQSLGPPQVALGMIVAFAGLLVRRRYPWVAVLSTVPLTLVAPTSFVLVFAVYLMASRRGPTLHTWGTVALTGTAKVIGQYPMDGFGIDVLLFLVALGIGMPLLLGLWIFQRRVLLMSLQERADQAERERDLLADRAVAAERRRIAREMHDVVAHRVSVISLQAGALTMTSSDKHTGEVAELIRNASTTALTELREMLRVLRDDTEQVESPAQSNGHAAAASTQSTTDPTLESVQTLVDDSVANGARIRLHLADPIPHTSGAVGRAAYRVVQESLTNAAKHAPHATVQVAVDVEDDGLAVDVSNPRGPRNNTTAVPGSGYGLIGMRERVTLAGGTLRTGWTDDDRYRVRALFPGE